MKGKKTKIASMILAASVTFMASACTVKISNNDTASTTEKVSGSEATTEATSSLPESSDTEATSSLPESSDEETESTTTLSESTSEKQITTNSIPAQYVEVLDYLYDGLKSGEIKNIDPHDLKYDMGACVQNVEFSYKNPKEGLWYTLLDLDDNGTDELLIMLSSLNETGVFDEVLELYTITDGQLDHIFSSNNTEGYSVYADKSIVYDGGSYPVETLHHEYLDGNRMVITDSYYSTYEIDGKMQSIPSLFHVNPTTGEDELIGPSNEKTWPVFGERYVFNDRTNISDYK